MKTKILDLLNALNEFAPLSYQESYDNSGLLTGNLNWDVEGVLFSLDCVESIVEEAKEKECNVVICHHPIIFKGLKSITGKNYVERTIIKAIKNDIAIIAWHTNLDNTLIGGVNRRWAELLDLKNLNSLKPKHTLLNKLVTYVPLDTKESLMNAMFAIGCGQIGEYSECSFASLGEGTFKGSEQANPALGEKGKRTYVQEARIEFLVEQHQVNQAVNCLKENHPYEEVAYELYSLENEHPLVGSGIIGELKHEMSKIEFLEWVKKKMGVEVIKYTKGRDMIKKVALCGGSGSFLINEARIKADAYITADIKYHEFFDAEEELLLCDIGHFESEVHTIQLLHDVITEKFSNFATLLTAHSTNPVNYYI